MKEVGYISISRHYLPKLLCDKRQSFVKEGIIHVPIKGYFYLTGALIYNLFFFQAQEVKKKAFIYMT